MFSATLQITATTRRAACSAFRLEVHIMGGSLHAHRA
jgi:hypothetical protein